MATCIEYALEKLKACPPSWSAARLLVSYLIVLAVLDRLLPGRVVAGAVLSDKSRKYYKCNGLLSLLLILFGLIGYQQFFSPLMVLADKVGELLATTLLFSILVSILIYAAGCLTTGESTSLKACTIGNVIRDWWFGVQLNPTFLGIDLKLFSVKAGMMGWFLLNLSIAVKQLQSRGFLTLSMSLYQAFSMVYVLDYFWFEEFMTSTWDIIAEKFGFMLIFGDLVWIPFTFSIQGWWLLNHTVELIWTAAALNILIFCLGFAVFRGANKEKHRFKKDPSCLIWGQPAKTIGGKLLVSGYWGIARHSNYLGDIILAFSFSLPCGASSVVPYFYPAYLLLLLLWRERRDELRCRQKYGRLWEEYCSAVPWRIFPYIY